MDDEEGNNKLASNDIRKQRASEVVRFISQTSLQTHSVSNFCALRENNYTIIVYGGASNFNPSPMTTARFSLFAVRS